jgi:tape measure domain-containing protein
MPEILKAARGLIQFGERGDDLMDSLNLLGNAASGTSTPFGFLALVFNQVRGVGKLLTQDFRQLSTRGVLSLQDLAKYYGVTTQAAQEMLSKGKVSFEDLKNILRMLSGEGGRFANLMEKQSQSLLGLWSTWKDALGIIVRYMGETVAPTAKSVVAIMIQGAEFLRGFIEEHKELVGNVFLAVSVVTALGVAWKGVAIAASMAAAAEASAAAARAQSALGQGLGASAGAGIGVGMRALLVGGAAAAAKFLVVLGLVTAAIWGIKKVWDYMQGSTNEENDALEKQKTQLDDLIIKRNELKSLKEEEAKTEKQQTQEQYQILQLDKEISRLKRIQELEAEIAKEIAGRASNKKTESMVDYKYTGKERDAIFEQLKQLERRRTEEPANAAAYTRLMEVEYAKLRMTTASEVALQIQRTQQLENQLKLLREGTTQQQKVQEMQQAYREKSAREFASMRKTSYEHSDQYYKSQQLTPFFGSENPFGEARKFIYDITDSPLRQFNELVAKIQACTRAGLGFAEASRIIKEEWEKSPMNAPTKQLEELRQTLWDLQNGTKDWEKQVREFSKQPFVTQTDIEEFASLSKQVSDFKEKAKAKKPESLISAGRYGFSDFFGQVQDALLKKDDPQKKLVEQGKATNNLLTSIEKNTRMDIGALK